MVSPQAGQERETDEAQAVSSNLNRPGYEADFGIVSIAVTVDRDPTPEERALIEDAEFAVLCSMLETRASDVLEQFAHDLRTPVANLLTRIYLSRKAAASLPEGEGKTTLLAHLDVMDKVLQQFKTQLQDITVEELFRPKFEIVQIAEVIDEVLLSINKVKDADSKVSFRLILPSSGLELWTDKRILISVISNILSNAFAYTHEGEIVLDIGVSEQNLVVKVKDTGRGIPEDKLPTIFDRGVSLSQTDRREDAPVSTGFGMYIVRRYVEELGGKVEVTSQIGVGTEFTVTVPLGS